MEKTPSTEEQARRASHYDYDSYDPQTAFDIKWNRRGERAALGCGTCGGGIVVVSAHHSVWVPFHGWLWMSASNMEIQMCPKCWKRTAVPAGSTPMYSRY